MINELVRSDKHPKIKLNYLRGHIREFKLMNNGQTAQMTAEWAESYIPQLNDEIEEIKSLDDNTHLDLLSQPNFALTIFYLKTTGYIVAETIPGAIQIAITKYGKNKEYNPTKLEQYVSYISNGQDKYFNKNKIQAIKPFLTNFPKAITEINKDLKDPDIPKDNKKKV
jgi:hypothetical protein